MSQLVSTVHRYGYKFCFDLFFDYLAIRKYSSGLNYYWNLLLDDDSLYVGGQ
jgi:hypothetical protein